MTTVKVKKLHPDAQLPRKATEGSAGFDVHACWPGGTLIYANETKVISTGLSFEIPKGYEIQVRPRSGLASKGVFVTNGPGTIDSDYRGEVSIILTYIPRYGPSFHEISHGDRIAQLVVVPVHPAKFIEVEEISRPTGRSGGFGSTGQ